MTMLERVRCPLCEKDELTDFDAGAGASGGLDDFDTPEVGVIYAEAEANGTHYRCPNGHRFVAQQLVQFAKPELTQEVPIVTPAQHAVGAAARMGALRSPAVGSRVRMGEHSNVRPEYRNKDAVVLEYMTAERIKVRVGLHDIIAVHLSSLDQESIGLA